MHWYDVITDQYVRNTFVGYAQDAPLEVFDVFPMVTVSKMEGLIPKYKKADWFKIGDVNSYKRTGATESAGDDFASDSQSYALEQYSFHKDVTKTDREQVETPYDAVNDSIKFIINRLRRVAFKYLVNEFITDGVWSNEETSPSQWDADNDPVDAVLTWQQAVESTTGFKPNKMIVTPDIYKALRTNSNITNLLSDNQTKKVSQQILANLFDLDQFIVMNAVNESADGYFAANKALLFYTPEQADASKFEPSAGYIMTYKMGEDMNMGTRRIPMPERNDAIRIEADMYMDAVAPAPDCGYFIKNLVS